MPWRDRFLKFYKWFKKIDTGLLTLLLFVVFPAGRSALEGYLGSLILFVFSGLMVLSLFIISAWSKEQLRELKQQLWEEIQLRPQREERGKKQLPCLWEN